MQTYLKVNCLRLTLSQERLNSSNSSNLTFREDTSVKIKHKMAEESGGFADMQLMVMDHRETFKHEEWKVSRELAEEMFRTIPGLNEKFKLDQITMGDGECFHTAVHQQLRRPDVQTHLTPRNKQLSKNCDMKAFKRLVRRFMLNNNHPNVARIKEDFEIFM